MRKAHQTLKAINDAIEADQGASFRELERIYLPKMEDAYRGKQDPFRTHLGISQIGKECSRALWYHFRWSVVSAFPARVLRLFNRGHLEEGRFLAMLKMIGCNLWHETEKGGQIKISHYNGHFGSALDSVLTNLPELGDAAAYGEFKTANDKSFKKIAANGVLAEQPQHYIQMQLCMASFDLHYGLYMVVNKNDDDLHAEIIELDYNVANINKDKASYIIFSDEAPPKINESPGWWKCRWCGYNKVCHGTTVPEINCRTCVHSTPLVSGKWSCAKGHKEVIENKKNSMVGCSDHVYNPHLLNNVTFHGGNGVCADITLPSGERVLQGPGGLTSTELKEKTLAP